MPGRGAPAPRVVLARVCLGERGTSILVVPVRLIVMLTPVSPSAGEGKYHGFGQKQDSGKPSGHQINKPWSHRHVNLRLAG